MSKLDKDIHQKEMAIRFCLVNDMTPFPEVDVQNFRELSTTSTIITDIDVLGIKIDSTGRPRRVAFDCKTLGKTSPINRAFWASGLMGFTGCDESFIILRKKHPKRIAYQQNKSKFIYSMKVSFRAMPILAQLTLALTIATQHPLIIGRSFLR